MKVWYDLHIHSVLSPCGDDEMTPNNVVMMAKMIGLDVIAVTDHNACDNCDAFEKIAKEQGITLLCGMELETSEEVHVVVLFPDSAKAKEFAKYIDTRRFKIANRADVYGQQLVLDENDEVVREEPNLLITATDVGIYEVVSLANEYGGVAFPAHIDRPSHGAIQMLGDVHEDMGFTAVEISPQASDEFVESYRKRGYVILRNSDAHCLENLNEQTSNFFELEKVTASAVLDKLAKR